MGFRCNLHAGLCLPELSGMFVEASYFKRSSADDLEMNVYTNKNGYYMRQYHKNTPVAERPSSSNIIIGIIRKHQYSVRYSLHVHSSLLGQSGSLTALISSKFHWRG